MSSTGNCDPEDARFERLESTSSSAEIKQFALLFEASYGHSQCVLFRKEKEEKIWYAATSDHVFFCLGWLSEHKGLLVTDTACLCLIPVCMLYQDTRDVPYAYITRSDLCVHTKGGRYSDPLSFTQGGTANIPKVSY